MWLVWAVLVTLALLFTLTALACCISAGRADRAAHLAYDRQIADLWGVVASIDHDVQVIDLRTAQEFRPSTN